MLRWCLSSSLGHQYKITLIGTSGNKRRRGGSKTKVRTVLIYSGHDPDIHHFERTER